MCWRNCIKWCSTSMFGVQNSFYLLQMFPQVTADSVAIGEISEVTLQAKGKPSVWNRFRTQRFVPKWRESIFHPWRSNNTYAESLLEDGFWQEVRQHPEHCSTLRRRTGEASVKSSEVWGFVWEKVTSILAFNAEKVSLLWTWLQTVWTTLQRNNSVLFLLTLL